MAKTKYSYLYNGQVVRNSNRLYKYGLVNHNNAVNLSYYIKHNDKRYIDCTKQDIANTEKWHVVELEVREN